MRTSLPWMMALVAGLLSAASALAQPAPPALSTTAPPQRQATNPRSSNRLASVPHMYGDFFGGGGYDLSFKGPRQTITQILNDNVFADYTVVNINGTQGAQGVNVPIRIFAGPVTLSQSIGTGQDVSGDGVADTFDITEPVGSAPTGLPPGTVEFQNGKAVYVQTVGPNTQQTPVNGTNGSGWNLITTHFFTPQEVNLVVPGGGGVAVRRIKIAENNSPEPRDRVFFNYNFFNDVQRGLGDVNRYTVGVEKTFTDGWQSLEVRVPMASTLNSDQIANGTNFTNTEFGNITCTWKAIIQSIDNCLVAGGVGVALPTADPTRVYFQNTQILEIENQSVHLLPYLAVMASPSESCFWQAFLQLDVDTRGNPVRGDITGANLQTLGRLNDQTILFVDLSTGYWLYENQDAELLTGVTPMLELHYATSTQDTDRVVGGGFNLRNSTSRFDNLNLTAAANLIFGNRVNVRPGFVIPLRTGLDKDFDFEFLLQVNVGL